MTVMTVAPESAVILLCPGQGAQAPGMGKAWAQRSTAARQTFEEADAVLGFPLSTLCFEGPAEELNRTDLAQAALYTTSVASWRGLLEAGVYQPEQVIAAAGLSLGEFTALHLAGALSFEDGLRLVRLRGQAMQQAAEASAGGMVALIRGDDAAAAALCKAVLDQLPAEVLVPANYNAPGQVVVSGTRSACELALRLAEGHGMAAKALAVAGAFHSPLMAPAADRLREALVRAAWATPRIPVLSNVTAQPHLAGDLASIRARLVEQLTQPVRWAQSMSWALAQLKGRFVELAPNNVLAGLMKRIDRKTPVLNHAEPA
jgi:[acyl-carrier-protein] S-malonyltransferase